MFDLDYWWLCISKDIPKEDYKNDNGDKKGQNEETGMEIISIKK